MRYFFSFLKKTYTSLFILIKFDVNMTSEIYIFIDSSSFRLLLQLTKTSIFSNKTKEVKTERLGSNCPNLNYVNMTS